jgi:hypothetical protein
MWLIGRDNTITVLVGTSSICPPLFKGLAWSSQEQHGFVAFWSLVLWGRWQDLKLRVQSYREMVDGRAVERH